VRREAGRQARREGPLARDEKSLRECVRHCILSMDAVEHELAPTRHPNLDQETVEWLRLAAIKLLAATVGVSVNVTSEDAVERLG